MLSQHIETLKLNSYGYRFTDVDLMETKRSIS